MRGKLAPYNCAPHAPEGRLHVRCVSGRGKCSWGTGAKRAATRLAIRFGRMNGLDELLSLLSLDTVELSLMVSFAAVAGLIRGFSGFALSAVFLCVASLLRPPIELLPVLLLMEIAASFALLREGWRGADRRISFALAVGSVVALPFGLWLTLRMSPDVSRVAALSVIAVLAILQLPKSRMATRSAAPDVSRPPSRETAHVARTESPVRSETSDGTGNVLARTSLAGLTAGTASGLAGVGGMVVALFTLSQDVSPARMRASLVLYIALSVVTSAVIHALMGTLDATAATRGFVLAVPSTAGVLLGRRLFVPGWERYYKPFCLWLLLVLAVAGIARVLLALV